MTTENEVVETKNSLNLTPNETVGFRLTADTYNWKVVAIKVYGENSKNAGQEYESTPLAHLKNLDYAALWLLNHATAYYTEKYSKEELIATGKMINTDSILKAVKQAKDDVLKAVKEVYELNPTLAFNSKLLDEAEEEEESTESS